MARHVVYCVSPFTTLRYSGELLQGDAGSVTMFAIPAEYGERCIDEKFVHALSMHEVYKRRTAQRSAANCSPDVISAGIALLQERIGRLRDHIGTGRVTIVPWHCHAAL
jgi:hypothetical protein